MVVLSRFFWLELRFLTPCLIRGSDRYSLQPQTGIGPQSTKSDWFGLVPLSLAATKGISVDFFSSGYLDVSVLRVRFYTLLIQM